MISLSVRCIAVIGAVCCFFLLFGVSDADKKFCGNTLTEALDLLCVHGYNEKLLDVPAKRHSDVNRFALESEYGEDSTLLQTPRQLEMYPASYSELNPIFVEMYYANLLAKTRRRRKDGIYDECCRKACTYTELAAYCRPG